MKQKYTVCMEGAPWQHQAANAISKLAQLNMMRGAGIGAAVGSAGNVVNNTLKRDDDPTKEGNMSAFFKVIAVGALTGGALGTVAGVATRQGLRKMGKELAKQGDEVLMRKLQNSIATNRYNELIAAGIPQNLAMRRVQDEMAEAISKGDFQRILDAELRKNNFKVGLFGQKQKLNWGGIRNPLGHEYASREYAGNLKNWIDNGMI